MGSYRYLIPSIRAQLPPTQVFIMVPSWLRQLFKKRFVGQGATRPILHASSTRRVARKIARSRPWTSGRAIPSPSPRRSSSSTPASPPIRPGTRRCGPTGVTGRSAGRRSPATTWSSRFWTPPTSPGRRSLPPLSWPEQLGNRPGFSDQQPDDPRRQLPHRRLPRRLVRERGLQPPRGPARRPERGGAPDPDHHGPDPLERSRRRSATLQRPVGSRVALTRDTSGT